MQSCSHLFLQWGSLVDSIPPSATYKHQWTGSALVQIMACRLFGAKPLSKPNAGLLSTGPFGTNFDAISIKIQDFSFTKMHLKITSAEWRPFCPGRDDWRLLFTLGLSPTGFNLVSFLSTSQHNRQGDQLSWGWINKYSIFWLIPLMKSSNHERLCVSVNKFPFSKMFMTYCVKYPFKQVSWFTYPLVAIDWVNSAKMNMQFYPRKYASVYHISTSHSRPQYMPRSGACITKTKHFKINASY